MKRKAPFFFFFALFLSCQAREIKIAEYTMGTVLEIIVDQEKEAEANEILKEIKSLEQVFSHFLPESEVKKLEQSYRIWENVSPPLYELFVWSELFFRLSGGLFDVSLFPVLKAKGVYGVPSFDPFLFLCARAQSGFYFVQIHPYEKKIRLLKKNMAFDFGGIGKGFAVDYALRGKNTKSFKKGVLNFGGQVTAFSEASEEVWVREAGLICSLKQMTLCVSSNRERKKGHIYDRREHDLVKTDRVSIAISPQATVCDALSTIGFLDALAGVKTSMKFPQTYFLFKQGKTWAGSFPPFCSVS